jgi:lipid-binding SYLF domain-containing protein
LRLFSTVYYRDLQWNDDFEGSLIMKQTAILLVLAAILLAASGCGPSEKKYTLNERRQIIDNMADESLERLCNEKPGIRQEVADSAGYAVFSNANVYVIFASAGGGYGVVVDKVTGRKTYMKMSSGGVGIGVGAKDYRQVAIFKTRQALVDFVGSGWDLGGQADATAQSGKKGGGLGGDGTLSKNVAIYTLTDNGLALQATFTGSRYWVDDDLNHPGL